MADLATLGIRAKVEGVNEAAKALDAVAVSAEKAEGASNSAASATEGLGKANKSAAGEASGNAEALSSITTALDMVRTGIVGLAGEVSKNTEALKASSGAADVASKAMDSVAASSVNLSKGISENSANLDKMSASANDVSTALSGLNVDIQVPPLQKVEKALSSVDKESASASSNIREFSKSADSASSPVKMLQSSIGGLSGALSVLGAAFSVKYVADLADSWSDMSSLVGTSIGDMNAAADVMERLSNTARMSYSSLELTASGFVRNSMVLRELGKTVEQQLDYQEALNNALVVSGARGRAAEFVQESLNRSMALGAMRGIELNNVLNYGGRIAEALAEHFNTTTGGLMKLAQEGKITAAVLYDVLYKNMETLRDEAEEMPATLGDAFQLMQNSILQSVGAMDQAGKVSEGLAIHLVNVADQMDILVKGAMALGIVLASRSISGYTSNITSYGASVVKAARATRSAAIDEQATAAARLKNAEAAMATARANGLVTASYRSVSRELLAARLAMNAANKQLAATTPLAVAASGAVRGLTAAMNALGGPVGVSIIGLSAIMYTLSARSQEAEDRANRYAEAIRKAGEASGAAAVGVEKTAEAMFKVSASMSEAQRQTNLDAAITRQAQAVAALTEEYNRAGRGISGLRTYFSEIYGPLGDLNKRFEDGQISVEDYISETDKLSRINPDMSAFVAKLQGLALVVAGTRGEINALNSALNNLGSGRGGRVRAPSLVELAAERAKEQEEIEKYLRSFSSRFGDNDNVVKSLKSQSDAITKAAEKATKDADRMASAYSRIVVSAKERLAQMELEEQLVGKNGVAADVLRMKLDMLYDAKKKGLKLTADQIKELNGLADAYGKVATRVAELQIMEEARFDRSQIGRSAIDQRIAAELRSAGIEMESAAGQAYASFVRTTDQIRIAQDETKRFASGFISDILNGKSALESLTGALQKLGDKLIDLALDSAINSLFGNLLGVFGGGAGSPFTSSGQLTKALGSGGIGLYAQGGVTDRPAIFGEAGPEAAVPLPDGRSIPVTLNSGASAAGPSTVNSGNVYNFTGTHEEFEQFKRFVEERDRQFDARAVHAVNKGSKKERDQGLSMAILPAITNIFEGVGIVDQRFQLISRQEFSRTASGVTIGRDLGPALWQASYTLNPVRHEDVRRIEARLNSLNGVTRGFYAGDIRGKHPSAYPDGNFTDSGVISSLNANGRMLTLTDLPAGFQISAGDYMEYDYGTGNGLRALLQVVNDVTASGGGVAVDVEFRPFIPPGTAIGAAVRFKNPRALFTLDPEGVEQTVVDSLFTQLSFSATQSFLR